MKLKVVERILLKVPLKPQTFNMVINVVLNTVVHDLYASFTKNILISFYSNPN